MKIHRTLLLVLSLVLTAAVVPSAAFAGDAENGTLTVTSARQAARSTAWKIARRNSSVDSVKVQSCQRRASDRAICQAVAQGATSVLKTSCSFQVRVRLVHGHPQASHGEVTCANEKLVLLRAARALTAIRPVAEALGGQDVLVSALGRQSRAEIAALAGWFRPVAGDSAATELCSVELRARLLDTGEVAVTASESRCAALD